MINKILQGNCLDVLKTLDDNSVDSIVTDPPYELGFMGKSWDNTGIAYSIPMWAECLRVLKPGGHLLAFSGTRTYHRMASAIEDAGFEVRDMIEWVYGCLSEDTEILTESGYKPLHKLTQYDRIGVYDITNNIYKWERPQRWSVYKVHQDTAYRIKSDYTDQIVSRNHRCLVEREGKLVFIQAEELNEVEYMPTLSEDFYSLQKNSNRKLLLKELLWKGKRLAQKVFSKWTGNKKSEERIEVRKEPSLERWSNLLEETRKLQADKICEVSEGVFTDGEKRWICNGTSFDNGSILGDMFRENPSSASYQSRPTGQQTGKPDVISIKQGTQITRRARVTKIEYSGIIFCPTVSTGAFIARRNGQVFITGNSGFPKSLNIGKAVDKINGIKNENKSSFSGVSETRDNTKNIMRYKKCDECGKLLFSPDPCKCEWRFKKSENEYEGWGTALKPAHEPICMARKPLAEKTVAENVLKYGTGGINIEQSRVLTPDDEARKQKILSGEVVCNAFCDKHGLYPSSLDDILSFSQQQLLDFYKHIFSELGSYSISYTNLLHNLAGLDYKSCKQLLGVPYDCGRLSERVDEYVCGRQKAGGSQSDYPTLSRLYGECVRWNLDVAPNVFPLNDDVQDDILHYLSSKENNLLDNSPHLVFVLVFLAYSLLVNNNLHNHYTTCKNKKQAGRFPANLIHDNSEEVRECFPETKGGGSQRGSRKWAGEEGEGGFGGWAGKVSTDHYVSRDDGTGNASRFFKSILYVPKASKSERNMGCDGLEEKNGGSYEFRVDGSLDGKIPSNKNNHPTVKPIALMEYLIKMVTPKGGIVLDPFAGSGSTLIAAKQNKFQYIGIELDPEYIKIAEARLNSVRETLL